MINEAKKMTDKAEQIRFVFEWFVSNADYNYEMLKYTRLNQLRTAMYKKVSRTTKHVRQNGMLSPNDYTTQHPDEPVSLFSRLEAALNELNNSDTIKQRGCFEHHSGVCSDFAADFEKTCNDLNISCIKVGGSFLSDRLGRNEEIPFTDEKLQRIRDFIGADDFYKALYIFDHEWNEVINQ